MPVYSELEPKQEGSSGQTHFRGKTVQRAIKSIINQQHPSWELIIVDDGCVDGITPDILDKFADLDNRIKVYHRENGNRAVALNYGMEQATGDFITWLDSDDEFSTHYVREMAQAIKDFPEYKIFNHGAIIHYPDHHTTIRPTYHPAIEDGGHEWFRSGQIGSGSFVFSRKLWADNQDKYRMPDESSPYHFAAASRFPMKFSKDEPHIENPEGAFQDGVYRHGLSLGNPWGQDFLQFYLLTRDNHSKPLEVLLYIQYPRSHEDVYEHFGEIYETD